MTFFKTQCFHAWNAKNDGSCIQCMGWFKEGLHRVFVAGMSLCIRCTYIHQQSPLWMFNIIELLLLSKIFKKLVLFIYFWAEIQIKTKKQDSHWAVCSLHACNSWSPIRLNPGVRDTTQCLPSVWQRNHYLRRNMLPPQCHINKNLESGAEIKWNVEVPSGSLTLFWLLTLCFCYSWKFSFVFSLLGLRTK